MDQTKEKLEEGINRLAPFHHNVELPHGLHTYVPASARRPRLEEMRVDNMTRHVFPALLQMCGGSLEGKRVLDAACNCGGFTVEAAKRKAAYVLGIDIVERYIEQANFIKDALDMRNIEFKRMGIEELDSETMQKFDVTFCFGILYNFENPILAMKRLAAVTKHIMLIDTFVLKPDLWRPPFVRHLFSSAVNRCVPFLQKPLWLMRTRLPPQSTEMPTSLWRESETVVQFTPNESAIRELMNFLGFKKFQKIAPEAEGLGQQYRNGERATFLAAR